MACNTKQCVPLRWWRSLASTKVTLKNPGAFKKQRKVPVFKIRIYKEDEQVIGSVKDLVVQSGCNFSIAEILCMESFILDELNWDLSMPLISRHPHLPTMGPETQKRPCFQVALWTRHVQHCMACHQLSHFKGSTLALAIITLELERLTPDWFSVFIQSIHFLPASHRRRLGLRQTRRHKFYDGFGCLYNDVLVLEVSGVPHEAHQNVSQYPHEPHPAAEG
uniref:Cyclin I family, member 2 n=1 Tax=Oncorhynchus mykiss TaxID=8022 RepID=A0A8K9UXE0_ONCMY